MAEEKIETNEIEEAVLAERQSLEYKAKDDDLIKAIDNAVAEARPLKEFVDKIGKKNERYWREGTEVDSKKIHPARAKIVVNRIFMSVETILPMLTSRTPEPMIGGEIANDVREKLVKALTIAYEVKQKIQQELQKVIRHWFLYRIGVWKYRWDEGFVLETVLPSKIGIDPRGTEDSKNCEFIYEQMEDTIEDLIEKFPKKKKQIIANYTKERMKSKVGYIEFWGGKGEWVAWKMGNILLDKMKNPNFDYGEATIVEGEEEYEPAAEGANLFKKPQFPYLILNVFNLGKNLYDDSSLIEQVIPLQDSVNKRKNQISDMTEENKKLIVASSKAISKEEFQKFINKYGMVGIWLDTGDISEINVIGGQADAATFNDLSHSIGEIDNIMGTHSTTRGERKEQETLGGRRLLTGADYGRIDTIIIRIEQLMENFYNAYLHMLKVYSTEDAVFSDGEETVKISREEIPEGIMVMVKKGSTLPVDKAARAEMAVKLAQFGFIDPGTLFEELGYGNEEERTKDLFEWLRVTGKIMPEQPTGGQEVSGEARGGAPREGGEGATQAAQLARLKEIMQSPKFKALPDDQKQIIISKAREITNAIKGGAK